MGLPVSVPAEADGGGHGLVHADGREVVVLVALDDALSGGLIDRSINRSVGRTRVDHYG